MFRVSKYRSALTVFVLGLTNKFKLECGV